MTVPAPGAPVPGTSSPGATPAGTPIPGPFDAAAPGGGGPGVPVPPAGPGVSPPFATPPVEGRTVRMWLGLGAAALAVVLCCGGGTAALVGLAVSSTKAINEQARTVVEEYLDAVRDREYARAYQMLCDDARQRESAAEFEERVADEPQIASYRVGDAALTNEVTVPVEVTYVAGGQDRLRASLAQDSGTGEFEVCEIR